jgi:hypothetical protein
MLKNRWNPPSADHGRFRHTTEGRRLLKAG